MRNSIIGAFCGGDFFGYQQILFPCSTGCLFGTEIGTPCEVQKIFFPPINVIRKGKNCGYYFLCKIKVKEVKREEIKTP